MAGKDYRPLMLEREVKDRLERYKFDKHCHSYSEAVSSLLNEVEKK